MFPLQQAFHITFRLHPKKTRKNDTKNFNPTVFSNAFSLFTKRRRPFGEKHAAFYPKARLLFEKAGGLLKFAARAFFKSWRPFRFALPRGLFHLLVLERGKHFLQVDARTESHLCTLNHRGIETAFGFRTLTCE